jgi:hypothetical protein
VCLATVSHFVGRKFSGISRLHSHPSYLVRVARSTCSQRRMRRNQVSCGGKKKDKIFFEISYQASEGSGTQQITVHVCDVQERNV